MNLGVLLASDIKRMAAEFLLKTRGLVMNVLVVDVGGTNVKVLAPGKRSPGSFRPGRR